MSEGSVGDAALRAHAIRMVVLMSDINRLTSTDRAVNLACRPGMPPLPEWFVPLHEILIDISQQVRTDGDK